MTHPDKENTLTLLTEWARHHAAIEKMMDGIQSSIGLDVEGPMFATVWTVFGSYTEMLVKAIGDHDGWLYWYRYEACMGKKSMAAGYDGKTRRIKTVSQLYDLIAESRKRKAQ